MPTFFDTTFGATPRTAQVGLNIRKATLRDWREAFAGHLRRVGVPANATPRVVRGETRPRKSDAVYRAARRGASTHMRAHGAQGTLGPQKRPRTQQPKSLGESCHES